jgi:hypothetical protein
VLLLMTFAALVGCVFNVQKQKSQGPTLSSNRVSTTFRGVPEAYVNPAWVQLQPTLQNTIFVAQTRATIPTVVTAPCSGKALPSMLKAIGETSVEVEGVLHISTTQTNKQNCEFDALALQISNKSKSDSTWLPPVALPTLPIGTVGTAIAVLSPQVTMPTDKPTAGSVVEFNFGANETHIPESNANFVVIRKAKKQKQKQKQKQTKAPTSVTIEDGADGRLAIQETDLDCPRYRDSKTWHSDRGVGNIASLGKHELETFETETLPTRQVFGNAGRAVGNTKLEVSSNNSCDATEINFGKAEHKLGVDAAGEYLTLDGGGECWDDDQVMC